MELFIHKKFDSKWPQLAQWPNPFMTYLPYNQIKKLGWRPIQKNI